MVGDMQLNLQQFKALKATRPDGTFLAGNSGLKHKWDGNEMPVEVSDNIYEYNTILVHKTISDMNRKMCGCFKIR